VNQIHKGPNLRGTMAKFCLRYCARGNVLISSLLWASLALCITPSAAFPVKTPETGICYPYNALKYSTSQANEILDTQTSLSAGVLGANNTTVTLAVCTTAVNPGPMLQAWLEYHLRRFDLIMVFIDDPSERPLFESLVHNNLHHDPRIMLLKGHPDRSDMSPSGVMNRQNSNTQVAVDIALENNITWLLHIDSDELFYEDGDRTWLSLPGVDHITFLNHEAVPVAHNDVKNPFLACTLFKVNGGRLDFMAYGNGKSAVRIQPGVQSWGVHTFTGYSGEHRTLTRPMILHYPNPSFDSWVAKYRSYGRFSNFWFEDPTQVNPLTFMLESRDRLHRALESGLWEEAREFFVGMIPDQEACERMLRTGDMRRYNPLQGI